MIKVSLVVPVYNEQNSLEEVIEKYITDLTEAIKEFKGTYEFIIVNDASNDDTLNILSKAFKKHTAIKILNLAERSGKQAAITAGMDAAEGDVIIIADVDLLNPVGILKQMLLYYFQGHQIVYAYREKIKGETFKYNLTKFLVNIATTAFSVEGEFLGKAQLQVFSRDVADVIVSIPNKNKYLRHMNTWTGYEILKVEYPSEYTKEEIKQKVQKQKQKRKESEKSIVRRDKMREHTPSVIYSVGLLIAAIIALTLNIIRVSTDHFNFGFGWGLISWLVTTMLFISSLLFFARAVLIRNVGIIHGDADREIYTLID